MIASRNLHFGTISTSFLLSATALPISLASFAFIYADSDSFWSVLWMVGVLPTICVAVIVLVVRDAVTSRPRSQIAGSVLLLTPTVLLLIVMFSPRFQMHQLFTFRPVDFYPHFAPNGLAFIHKFSVCAPDASCAAHSAAGDTKTFALRNVPDGCCTLEVINGSGEKHKVAKFRVFLNGEEVNPRPDGSAQIAPDKLGSENKVTVQLTGADDAFIHVIISYTGKKSQPIPAPPPTAG
jgi:hypothetical protein